LDCYVTEFHCSNTAVFIRFLTSHHRIFVSSMPRRSISDQPKPVKFQFFTSDNNLNVVTTTPCYFLKTHKIW